MSDTGVGLPEGFHAEPRDTLGLQLVTDLARQLQGEFKAGPGPTFAVAFRGET